MSWTIEKTIPTLAVPELEVGIEFYARLGFEVDWRFPETAPNFAGLKRGGSTIMLAECEPAVLGAIDFVVDDVSACHAELIAGRCWETAATEGALAARGDCPPPRALEAPPEPVDTEYGLRNFTLIDPWGHQLSFGEVIRE